MVDVDTKKILVVQVTDDRTGNSPMLIPLLDDALKNCVPQTSESGHAGRFAYDGDVTLVCMLPLCRLCHDAICNASMPSPEEPMFGRGQCNS